VCPLTRAEAAVRHMARSLAVEWATQNIRVNCIAWVPSLSTFLD
jgi:NAD(P)-dependent dehydrogenase (short-subunit alcohol dehydrogenase family)